MKKNLLNVSAGLLLLYGVNSNAQTIQNANFDSWQSTPYNDLTGWATSNPQTLQKSNVVTTTSVTGFSGKAVHLQTHIVGPDTNFAYIVNGSGNGDPIAGQGGLPYSQKPSGIKGYCKYNLPGNDTAIGFILFKKNGTVLCKNTLKFRGTGSQPTFTAFNYTLAAGSLTVTPDSVVMAFASSNAIPNVGIQNNSFLEIDSIYFTGAGITQTITNGDFENWTSNTYDKINNWSVAGVATKVAPGQSGPFAVELQTMLYNGNQVGQSGITNGYYTQNGPPKGGQPYTLTQDTLYGYYKFSGSSDSGVVFVNLLKNHAQIGGSTKYLKSQANWTLFKMPISSGTAPDTMRIEIYSSQPGASTVSAVGSKLDIDNLYLVSQPVGLLKLSQNNSDYIVYPNPASDKLVILNSESIKEIRMFDAKGMEMEIKDIVQFNNSTRLNISNLSNGIYFLSINNGKNWINSRFVKQ